MSERSASWTVVGLVATLFGLTLVCGCVTTVWMLALGLGPVELALTLVASGALVVGVAAAVLVWRRKVG